MGTHIFDNLCNIVSQWKTSILKLTFHEMLNIVSPPLYFFTIIGAWYYGTGVVLPWYYQNYSSSFLNFHQILGTIICMEMMVNWICIRCADSFYLDRKYKREDYTRLIEDSIKKQRSGSSNKPIVLECKYWSWAPCLVCQHMRPPRCHHCPLCNKCVLKRDHHCYFARTCVGFNNQRHFVVFCFWAIVACVYGIFHSFFYLKDVLWPHMTIFDLLFPVSILRSILGYLPFQTAILICVATMIVYFIRQTWMLFVEMITFILQGLTKFEEANCLAGKLIVTDKRLANEKMRSVFGKYWILNFIFPIHMIYKPLDDPFNWPNTTVESKSK